MDRTDKGRRALIGLGASALCWPATILAQAQRRVSRVVVATPLDEKARGRFRAAFAEHGWVDGRNLELKFVPVAGAPEGEAAMLARAVVASRPDAILIVASTEMSHIERLTKDIPIVFYNLGTDPAKTGLVQSLSRPGGNITGTSLEFELVWPKAWEMLKQIHPTMKRGGLVVPAETETPAELERKGGPSRHVAELKQSQQAAAGRLGIELGDVAVSHPVNLANTVDAIRKSKAEALVLWIPWQEMPGLLDVLETDRIPACALGFSFVRKGGLLAVGFDFSEGERQAIAIVARILAGQSPASIPVYQGTRYRYAVNVRVARAMGLAIPGSLRMQAAEVVE